MFQSHKAKASTSKCLFTQSQIASQHDYVTSIKGEPLPTISSHQFNHTVDLVVPCSRGSESVDVSKEIDVGEEVCKTTAPVRFSRVYMTLSEMLDGDFFQGYVKSGHALMLSEGRSGVDNLFSLDTGTLRLEIDKATYERCGLSGTAIPDQGRKHVKSRFAVSLNLKEPSMRHGKKGFERVRWAFRNVLIHSISWLFHDFRDDGPYEAAGINTKGALSIHHPIQYAISATELDLGYVNDPSNLFLAAKHDPLTLSEMHEWLGMLFIASPRVRENDVIDPYLSSYFTPDFGLATDSRFCADANDIGGNKSSDHDTTDASANIASGLAASDTSAMRLPEANIRISKYRWHGFISAAFVGRMLLSILKLMWKTQKSWASINVSCFGGANYTILVTSGGTNCFTWHCQ